MWSRLLLLCAAATVCASATRVAPEGSSSVVASSEDGESNLASGANGLGLNHAKHGGSARGHMDAKFHEGPEKGIHDPSKGENAEDNPLPELDSRRGRHANTKFAGIQKHRVSSAAQCENEPFARGINCNWSYLYLCCFDMWQYHDQFVPIEGIETTMRVIRNGTGDRAVEEGDVVTVHAKGIHKHVGRSPGHIFYSTKDPKQGGPFTYKVGSNKLPIGWDIGCRGMKVGEKREFDIPWQEVRLGKHPTDKRVHNMMKRMC